jgi:hypothetical protein
MYAAWITNKKIHNTIMFPELLAVDTTGDINIEDRMLMIVAFCQITDGDKQIYDPIDILTRDPNSTWNVKHILCQFNLVTHKFDIGILKKSDRGIIISQVKNWITSWFNYCENKS